MFPQNEFVKRHMFRALNFFPASDALFFKGIPVPIEGPPFDKPIVDRFAAVRAGATLHLMVPVSTLAAPGTLTTVRPQMPE